jgi:hypothetical protein
MMYDVQKPPIGPAAPQPRRVRRRFMIAFGKKKTMALRMRHRALRGFARAQAMMSSMIDMVD